MVRNHLLWGTPRKGPVSEGPRAWSNSRVNRPCTAKGAKNSGFQGSEGRYPRTIMYGGTLRPCENEGFGPVLAVLGRFTRLLDQGVQNTVFGPKTAVLQGQNPCFRVQNSYPCETPLGVPPRGALSFSMYSPKAEKQGFSRVPKRGSQKGVFLTPFLRPKPSKYGPKRPFF